MEEIARGAEAVIFRDKGNIIKRRVKKVYRIKEIDEELRKRRTKAEAKLLSDARRLGVNTPLIYDVSKDSIEMESVEGIKAKDCLNEDICREIGQSAAKLHNGNIIHGDLTTSNMIVSEKGIFFIDFGLGFFSSRIEDRAVDIRLFMESLAAVHADISKSCRKAFLKGYENISEDYDGIIARLEAIEKRGRYIKRKMNLNVENR